jgi:hypothetical protein
MLPSPFAQPTFSNWIWVLPHDTLCFMIVNVHNWHAILAHQN